MLHRRRATFPSASCFHRRAYDDLAITRRQALARHIIPVSSYRLRFLVTIPPLKSMQSNTPPSASPTSPVATCKWKRARPVYASYGSTKSRHSAPANCSLVTAQPCAPAGRSTAQQGQFRHASSDRISMADSTPANEESIGNALGRMSLDGEPRALHFAPATRMDVQHIDSKVTGLGKMSEHITLPDDPSQSSLQDSMERNVIMETQASHQVEIDTRSHDKDRDTTQSSLATQSEHTMDNASDSEYVPSQDTENNPEERKNESGSEENESAKEEEEDEGKEEHIDLEYQIPAETLRAAMLAPPNTRASFWSAQMYRGSEDQSLSTHYCRTKEVAERVAQYFLTEKVLGFDIEWKPLCFLTPTSIKMNASLIQLASEDRIALFHISLFAGSTAEQLMPPTLKTILESPDILKVGVAVKGDFTRLQKFLNVQPQGVFELSRLHNLVEGHGKDKKMSASNKLIRLSQQVLQHLQLPLYKGSQLADDPTDTASVRESDWSKPLSPKQIHYAAADAYAGFRLYHILEWKRKQLRPTPPTRGICDYDAKRVERPKVPKEKDDTTKAKDADFVAPPEAHIAELGQASGKEQDQHVVEEEEENDEEGYETAPEENIDSHELEDAMPSSVEPAKQATIDANSTANESVRSQRRVGRVNMSWLRGVDPGYPALPQEPGNPAASTESPDAHGIAYSATDIQDANQSLDPRELEAKEDDADEFADPELDEALQDMELDSDGKLIESMTEPPVVLEKDQYRVRATGSEASSTTPSPSEAHTLPDTQPGSLQSDYVDSADELTTHDSNDANMDRMAVDSPPNTEIPAAAEDNAHSEEYSLGTAWAQEYLRFTIPSPTSNTPSRIRATTPHLRAYHLWHYQKLSVEDIAGHLRDPPLAHSTVSGYILQAVSLERLEYDNDTMRAILKSLPIGMRQGKWKGLVEKVG